ncbi:Rv3235 family protein [Couchioplanes caeruleus]|uniref:Rv3235 family protein n=1 Tax=Couchioplanes caeruleus TaxID=56438 RepID=UPI0020BFB31F|nr:Rv3235 family protein [Couchioplanes caeruleus]UQU68717.1 Rv3235 family protein [Couchioplanes caeruleus]
MTRQDVNPAIRLRRAPHHEPPYDDEREPDDWASPHQLAFDLARLLPATRRPPGRSDSAGPSAPARPAVPAGGGDQAAGSAGASARAAGSAGGTAPAAGSGAKAARTADSAGVTARAAGSAQVTAEAAGGTARPAVPATGLAAGVSPDARLAVRRFVGSCIEVLNGYRPAAHLRRLAQPREAAAVVAQGVTAAHRVAEARRGTGRPSRSHRPAPAAVVKVSLCEPRPGAVEAAAVLVIGDRSWALALRLELHDDAWLATVLRLI